MQRQTLKLVRGDDVDFLLTLKDKSGQFISPDGLRFDLHVVGPQGEVLIDLSTENGGINIGEDGKIHLNFAHEHTAQAEWTVANYDLQLTTEEGKRKTIMFGKVQLTHDYTRI